MKTEELKAKGLTQEQIDFVMAENGKDVNAVVAERDGYKSQLDSAQASLKALEGVDASKLQGEITRLTDELKGKDGEIDRLKADYKFDADLTAAIKASGARSDKAVKAFLNLDALKASKNQDADIKTALEEVKKENAYLFEADKPVPKIVSATPGMNPEVQTKRQEANEALRGLFGKE